MRTVLKWILGSLHCHKLSITCHSNKGPEEQTFGEGLGPRSFWHGCEQKVDRNWVTSFVTNPGLEVHLTEKPMSESQVLRIKTGFLQWTMNREVSLLLSYQLLNHRGLSGYRSRKGISEGEKIAIGRDLLGTCVITSFHPFYSLVFSVMVAGRYLYLQRRGERLLRSMSS